MFLPWKNKHISNTTMPQAIKEQWIAALRSGDYRQGRSTMCTVEDGQSKFCCLGVLQHCLTGGVEQDYLSGSFLRLPSYRWLKEHNINFYNECFGQLHVEPFIQIGDGFNLLSNLNDLFEMSFTDIANLIEKNIKGN